MTIIHPSDLTQRRMSDMSDVDRLWWSQFGNRYELTARVLAIAAGGIGIWLYDGSVLGPFWALMYFIALGVSFFVLRPADPTHPTAWAVGMVSYFAIASIFASLPIYLLASPDPVLMFCGAFGLITLGAFTLLREEPPAIIQPLDIAIAWIGIGVAGFTQIPGNPSLAAQAIMTLLSIVAGGYYTLAVISVRAVRVELRDAARQGQEAQKMEAIGKLSGGIAHNFNNILTVLQGSLELYHEVPSGPERDALVNDARSASARATGLVAQLLAFARRAPLEPRAHDAGGVVDALAATAHHVLPDGMQLDTRQMAQSVDVLADPDGLQAALMNLLLNARDALDLGGSITLAVDLTQGPAAEASSAPAETAIGAHLRFSVADDGTGMAPEVLASAFDPFFTTKPKGQGSGLGLPMAMGFAEQSGGALRVKTNDDGTTVALHLPIAHGASGTAS